MGSASEPSSLKPVAIGNVGGSTEQVLDEESRFAEKQPNITWLFPYVPEFREGMQRKLWRHKVDRCTRPEPVTKLVDYTVRAAIP
jgi:hypothetical protein